MSEALIIPYPRAFDTKKTGFEAKKSDFVMKKTFFEAKKSGFVMKKTFFEAKKSGFVMKKIFFDKKKMQIAVGPIFPAIENITSTIKAIVFLIEITICGTEIYSLKQDPFSTHL
jgi:hypothetical protein